MNIKSFNFLIFATFAFLLTAAFIPSKVLARNTNDYGPGFGLFVHEQNKNLAVPKTKGIQALHSFFADMPLRASYEKNKGFMTQREFLLAFEKLRLEDHGKESILPDDILYPLTWVKVRRMNWLPDTKLTFNTMREFLYRYEVSQKHGDVPYYEGLVLEKEEINVKNFDSINQVRDINQRLNEHVSSLKKLNRPTRTQASLLVSLNDYKKSFDGLEKELELLEHPLYKIPNLPEDIRQKITEHGLNEILGQISYDYSGNQAYRKHNLVRGISNLSGRVYEPGESMNFYDVLSTDGWGVYKQGYALMGTREVLVLGGGVCGSATLAFGPSWLAGLEIEKRYSHSTYYNTLYPEIGLDATIFGRQKNLIVKNNTASPMLYYVQNNPEEESITVFVIGNSPYKNIEVEGPVKTGNNAYKWIRRMERFDGTVVEDELFSRYRAIK